VPFSRKKKKKKKDLEFGTLLYIARKKERGKGRGSLTVYSTGRGKKRSTLEARFLRLGIESRGPGGKGNRKKKERGKRKPILPLQAIRKGRLIKPKWKGKGKGRRRKERNQPNCLPAAKAGGKKWGSGTVLSCSSPRSVGSCWRGGGKGKRVGRARTTLNTSAKALRARGGVNACWF